MEKKKKVVRKTVTIIADNSDNDNGNMDELYCAWHTCPDCGEYSIAEWFKFCPGCGKRIRWKK